MLENYTNFTPVDIIPDRAYALAELLTYCKKLYILVDEIKFLQNGFLITFKGLKGDVILHDHSYGRERYQWESFQFPWDYDDVSVHSSKEIAYMIRALLDGEDWADFEAL